MTSTEKRFVADPSPWVPMSDPVSLKVLGKFLEELHECSEASAAFLGAAAWPGRCLVAAETLAKEIADVLCNLELVVGHFELSSVGDGKPADAVGTPIVVLLACLGQAGAAAARCLIQGIDESEPSTGVPNRAWLSEAITILRVVSVEAVQHYSLDASMIRERMAMKREHLLRWHQMEGAA